MGEKMGEKKISDLCCSSDLEDTVLFNLHFAGAVIFVNLI